MKEKIINTFKLEAVSLHTRKIIPRSVIDSIPEVEVINNLMGDCVLDMKARFFSELVDPDVKTIIMETKIPKDWFQHFKSSVFPKWLLKKFPAKIKTIENVYEVSVKNIYPDCFPNPPSIPFLKLYHTDSKRINRRQATIIIRNVL